MPGADTSVCLVVKTIIGNEIQIVCDLNSNIIDFKHFIFEKNGIPAKHQTLIYNGKVLQNDYKISYYEFDEEHSIYLVIQDHDAEVWEIDDCNEGVNCQHYQSVKKYKYSLEFLYHLESKHHPTEQCKYGQDCYAHKRLINRGHRVDDLCHNQIYSHPARVGHGSQNDWKELQFAAEGNGGNHYYSLYNVENKWEKGKLTEEIVNNRYKYVLSPTSGPYETLSEVVMEKLNHPVHKAFGSPLNYDEMLSIILYTGTDAYKDLRNVEMNHNYQKWKHFRINLSNAIHKLPSIRKNDIDGSNYVYHGLHKVDGNMCVNSWSEPYTVMSATKDISVAVNFAKNEGSVLLFKLSGDFGFTFEGADVSWISKFPNEKEVLLLPNQSCLMEEVGRDSFNSAPAFWKFVDDYNLKQMKLFHVGCAE
eukprot:486298_1